MKKIISLLFIFTVLITYVFSDKNSFYENGKVIDVMYVNSKEGLRVRNKPTLVGSNKIVTVPHGVIVKIVAIGQEENIDELCAPWVEILIPSYLWKSDTPEYGWVYGGYLTKKRPTGTLRHLYGKELESYLISIKNWEPDGLTSMWFYDDHTFRYATDKVYGMRPLEGRWEVKDNTIVLYHSDKPNNEYLKVINTEKGYFEVTGAEYVDNGKYCADFYEAVEENNLLADTEVFYFLDDYNFIDSSFYLNYSKSEIVKKLIIRGFRPYEYEDSNVFQYYKENYDYHSPNFIEYMKMYRNYWDPIMKEHQKKVDAMK